ncbi:hypothetical protein N7450_006766 [Penicillium hetheringtonii]|uniref:GPI anchored protein n=1 Tax=Penicillium hetheringtonii TaxID=911720 RepID=A0AAD6GRY1_9EURO|nr:hypothetical protein N7450_006766 [Penicillium hetheringtonii]
MKGFVGGIPLALLAAAAQAQAMEHTMNTNGVQARNHNSFEPQVGGTALGGPSGNDEDGNFNGPYGGANIHTHTKVDEYSKDDHSIKVKDTHVYPPNVHPGPALGPGAGPFPIKRGWPNGGTAEGGPSGDDEGQVFNMPITGNFNTDVSESSTDDHSVDVKNKHIHPPPVVAPVHVHPPPHFDGPPAGPPNVHGPPTHGPPHGPHFGGPPPFFQANDNNNNNHNGDHDHFNIAQNDLHHDWVKRFGPPAGPGGPHGPPHFGGPPPFFQSNGNNNNNDNGDLDYFHITQNDHHKDWVKRFGPEAGGTALGGPGGGGHGPAGFPGHNGGTALGGPSGDDEGINYGRPTSVDVDSGVNEYSKDDHSIDVKHTDVHPPPVLPFGPPFKRHWGPHNGGTALGGPSGNDEGQTFNMPITVNTHTGINEQDQDDHSVKVKDTHISPPPIIPHGGPFRRAYSPDSPERTSGAPNGGTALGGPSGDDDGENFGSPVSANVDTGVNEHSEDDHSVDVDDTHIGHPHYAAPELPWMTYPEATTYEVPASPPSPPSHEVEQAPPSVPQHEVPEHKPAPPSTPRVHEEDVPECHAKVQTHEVVHTVTKTQYKQVHPTETMTVYQQASTPVAVPTHGVPQANTPMDDPASKVYSSAAFGTQAAPAPASSSHIPYQSYNYNSQRPMSTGAYSMIPVHVPMVTPSSSAMMKSMATPSASHGIPSGADAMHSASASSTPSHGVMFTGAASRMSGGIFSAAAAVAGVLAFIL